MPIPVIQQPPNDTQTKIRDTLQECLDELRDTDPDDGRTYFLSVMNIISECLSAQDRHSDQMTPAFTKEVYEAGNTALGICGDRLLHLCNLAAPTNMRARAKDFQPFRIATLTAAEEEDVHGDGYQANCRVRLRSNVNALFEQPTQSDVGQWRLTCAGGVLMMGGGCMKASKDLFPDAELDAEEIAWREELLEYTALAVVGLAQSLSDAYGGRGVKVWGEVVSGSSSLGEEVVGDA